MRVCIISCFDTYEERVDLLHDYFNRKGHIVNVIQSDFRHIKKVKRVEKKNNFIFIESKPYIKNISFRRLSSHYAFAKRSFKVVENLNPDLLYVMIPPNSLGKFAAKYKKKHNNVKLIFDLIDLWPETMPIGKVKNLIPFWFWGELRNKALKYSDFIITECNLYQEVLKKYLKESNTETVYLAKRDINIVSTMVPSIFSVNLCYLGSINNIIDISKIKLLIEKINIIKPVIFHIIGAGENKDFLINEIISIGVEVKYYGEIYDIKKKQEIFEKCNFGLNIMKNSVCVGLTTKSIDYFQGGLPIINSIKSDTANIVEKYNIGFNISNENIEELAEKISRLTIEELMIKKMKTKKVFDMLFSFDSFNIKVDEIINRLL